MAENTIQMQHATKAAASFTAGDKSFDSDEDGVVSIPSTLTGAAKSHGFEALAVKPVPKPLAKAAKGGEPELIEDDGEPKKPEEVKPAQKGAKAAKGGEQ